MGKEKKKKENQEIKEKKRITKLIKITMGTITVRIIIGTMEIGNNSKSTERITERTILSTTGLVIKIIIAVIKMTYKANSMEKKEGLL